ncbi:MAG: transcriptional regulator [Gammaproteobacteria bacterium]|nr:MAG: transcriptional regulator [Pseudomonadota bacterium]PIE38221.1 MAG: transcriptional regulator [Gammaproteobacteria bacterium]
MTTDNKLSPQALELIAMRFKLLGDPMRLTLLHAMQNGEKSVSQLVAETNASQPNISKHLSALRNAGLVKRRQESNQAFFSIGAPFVFDLCDIVCDGISKEISDLGNAFDN